MNELNTKTSTLANNNFIISTATAQVQLHQQVKEKSVEKLLRQVPAVTTDSHQIVSAGSELITPKKRVLYDETTPIMRHQTNSSTFAKSNQSPTKVGPGGKFPIYLYSVLKLLISDKHIISCFKSKQ